MSSLAASRLTDVPVGVAGVSPGGILIPAFNAPVTPVRRKLVRKYARNGSTLIPRIITPEHAERCRAEAERLLDEKSNLVEWDGHDHGGEIFDLHDPEIVSKVFWDLLHDENVVNWMCALVSAEDPDDANYDGELCEYVELQSTKLFKKPAGVGGGWLAHRDNDHYPHTHPRIKLCALTFFLSPIVDGMGGLGAYDGSHRLPKLPLVGGTKFLDDSLWPAEYARIATGPAGAALGHGGFTVHRSGQNMHSRLTRWTFNIQFRHPRSRPLYSDLKSPNEGMRIYRREFAPAA
jgi:hypothetical protein